MPDAAFEALLERFMDTDPWPLAEGQRAAVEHFLDDQSRRRRYRDWVSAYEDRVLKSHSYEWGEPEEVFSLAAVKELLNKYR